MNVLRAAALVAAIPMVGCVVLKKDYDQVVADAAQARTAAETQHAGDEARIADLQQHLTAAEAATQERDAKISDLSTGVHNLQAQLDEATAINQQLRAELVRLGKDADKLLSDRGTLSKALDDARARLEELRRAQAAAEARTALFRDFELRFRPMILAGQLRVETRRGQLVMSVSGDLLFEPGHSELRAAGKGAMLEIAKALQGSSAAGRRFLVTAYVDDDPLKGNKRFHSTWELTAARAVTAVEVLTSVGVAPGTLVAAGAGSFDPVGPDGSPEDRARNRRLEIALAPEAPPAPATPPPAAPPAATPPPKG